MTVEVLTKAKVLERIRLQRKRDEEGDIEAWLVVGVHHESIKPKTFIINERVYKENNIFEQQGYHTQEVIKVPTYNQYRNQMGLTTQQEVVELIYNYSKGWEHGITVKYRQGDN